MIRRLGLDRRMAIGLGMLLTVGTLVVLVFSQVLNHLLTPGGTKVTATFADTGQLRPGDKVRLGGVDVGQVDKLTLDRGGRSATVTMGVLDDALPLYADATAAVRFRTALGGNFAVDLTRGSERAGTLSERAIPLAHTTSQVEVDDVLTAFPGAARNGMRTMIDEFARALRDRGAPGAALRSVSAVAPDLQGAMRAARGLRDGDLARLVATAQRTAQAIQTPGDEVRDVIAGGAQVTAVTAARRREITETLQHAGAILPRTSARLSRLRATLRRATPLLRRLQAGAAELAPALRVLRPTVVGADRLLQNARPLVRDLRPAARSLAQTASNARPLLDELEPSIVRADKKILPAFAERDSVSKRTAYEMVGPTIAGMDGAMGQFDSEGLSFFRFPASMREGAVDALPCKALLTDPERKDLVVCDSLVNAITTYFNYLTKPLPKP